MPYSLNAMLMELELLPGWMIGKGNSPPATNLRGGVVDHQEVGLGQELQLVFDLQRMYGGGEVDDRGGKGRC